MKASMAKKTLAAVAVTAMLMMSLFSMTAAASVDDRVYMRGENLLANPGFEETTDPNTNEGCPFSDWYFDSVTESSWSTLFNDGPSRSGAIAAATWCDMPFEMTVSQDVDVPEAGTYEASMWVSLGYATFDETVLRVTKDGEVVKQTSIPAAANNTDTSYRQIHLKDIELEAGAYAFELVIDCTGIGSNSFARIDDAFLGIQKLDPEPPAPAEPVELLTNGGFEGSLEPWTATAASGIIGANEGEAHGGTGAVATWSSEAFELSASQPITVEEAGTVEGSAWVALGYADFDAVELRVKDADDSVVAKGSLSAVSENTDYSYRQVVLEETALEAGSYTVEVVVPCTASRGNAWARIDDVSLVFTATPAQENPDGDVEEIHNYMVNGSFEEVDEEGFVGWTYTATNDATTFNTDPRTGEKALGALGDKDYNLTVSQTVTLEEAGDYMVSIWVASGFAAYPNTELRVLQNDELVASGRRFAVSARNDMTDYLRAVVPVAALEAGEVTIELSVDCVVEGLEVNEGEEIDGFIRVDDATMVKLAAVTVNDDTDEGNTDDGNTGDNTGDNTDGNIDGNGGDNVGGNTDGNTDGNTGNDNTNEPESPDTGVATAMPIVFLAGLSLAVVAATRKTRV